MDLRDNILTSVAYLFGVVTTLKRLYRPQFEEETAIAAALNDIKLNEQQALMRIASMARARTSRGLPV